MQSQATSSNSSETQTGSSVEQAAEETLREAMELKSGLGRLGQMAGIKSLLRSLRMEDDAAKKDIEANQRVLWGDELGETGMPEGEEQMEVIAARDVIVQNAPKTEQPAAQQPPPVNPYQPPPAQPQPQKSGWMPAAVAAAGIGAGALGYGLANRNQLSANTGPEDSAYEVVFYDADGNKIPVPHVSEDN